MSEPKRRSPRLHKQTDADGKQELKQNEKSEDEAKFDDEINASDNLVVALEKLHLKPEKSKKRPTALVYDNFMMKHKILSASSHVEDPQRIKRIFDELNEAGLVERCQRVSSRHATVDEIITIHEAEYVKLLDDMSTKSKSEVESFERQFNSIYFCQDSFKCATMAVGSLLNVVDAVMTSRVKNGVAIVRPPGHHAESDYAYGFCFFNNVAIAAKYAKQEYDLKRILILDWDVHHGNGTQNAFYDSSEVMYVSLHRHDYGYFFPVKGDSDYCHIGEGRGKGYNINIAWNKRKMGDPEYMEAFSQIIMPVALQYKPELVLVSAGFDAAVGDPLGGYTVSPECFAHMTHLLSSLADGRVILALEGGYNLTSISRSMAACTRILLGDELPELEIERPLYSEAAETISNVVKILKPFWTCFGTEEEEHLSDKNEEKTSTPQIVVNSEDMQLQSDTSFEF